MEAGFAGLDAEAAVNEKVNDTHGIVSIACVGSDLEEVADYLVVISAYLIVLIADLDAEIPLVVELVADFGEHGDGGVLIGGVTPEVERAAYIEVLSHSAERDDSHYYQSKNLFHT